MSQTQAAQQSVAAAKPVLSTARIEAFSDGVFAIALTILVLELKVPDLHGRSDDTDLALFLQNLLPQVGSYFLSFLLIAIYWVNHHHLFHLIKRSDAGLLWANNHLLLWLSLLSFPTGLLGVHPQSPLIAALYGVVLWLTAFAFFLLHRHAFKAGLFNAAYSMAAYNLDRKSYLLTLAANSLLIALAWRHPVAAECGYALLALTYFLPRVQLR